MSRRPARIAISVAPGERDALTRAAHAAGEPIATHAGRIIRAALAADGAQLDAPPARRAGPDRPRRARRPVSTPAAAAIERLRERYPTDLRHAPADPTTDTLVAEQLVALAAWRDDLDNATERNPREILAFGHELRIVSAWLQDRARRSR